MSARCSYEITLDWGDPREPEYRNGLVVSCATYREGGLYLRFKIVGMPVADSQQVRWTLEVPKNARQILGKRWAERSAIFKRVTEYLERLESSDHRRIGDRTYVGIVVDTSKVSGWLPNKLVELDQRLLPISVRLPSKRTFPLILLGLAIAYFNHYSFVWLPRDVVAVALLSLALASLALLFREVRRRYELSKGLCAFAAFAKPNYNWRLEALKMLAISMGSRIAVTSLLAALLVQQAWMSGRGNA